MLLVALAGVSANVQAQWAVVDAPHTVLTQTGWVAQYKQFYEELSKVQTQMDNLKFNMEKYSLSAGILPVESMPEKRRVDYMVNERCSDNQSGLLSGVNGAVQNLVQGFLSNGESNPKSLDATVARQRQICALIVQTENVRYNVMVDLLETSKQRDRSMEEIRGGMRSATDSTGQLQMQQAKLDDLQGQLTNDAQKAKILMDTYGATLSTLRDEKAWLARNAYKVSGKSMAGQLIQYGSLKLALEAAKTRDR